MKAHKKIITIKTHGRQNKQIPVMAFNNWCYHKSITNSNYVVTHISSGMSLPFHNLYLQKKARILAEMLENMTATWNGKGTPNKKFEKEALSIKTKFVEDIA